MAASLIGVLVAGAPPPTPDLRAASSSALGGPTDVLSAGPRYTADLTDEDLAERWRRAPDSLGSASVGYPEAGRLVNGVPFPRGKNWEVVDPRYCFATEETVAYLVDAINTAAGWIDGPPLPVGHISRGHGGHVSPHISHQAGRDVDLGFYRVGARWGPFDVARNWALVRALVTRADVEFILVDARIQKRLFDYALSSGEDRAWLDSLFHAGRESLVFHAPGHADHFHVRFFNPRAQELGRRLQPLLPQRSQPTVATHEVLQGETLAAIALRYDTSVGAIQQVNHLAGGVQAGRKLTVPLNRPRGAVPTPRAAEIPARREPPTTPMMFQREKAPRS